MAVDFGPIAHQYDLARPIYPSHMVSDLLAEGPAAIVDAGCGTGKAGRLFLGLGRQVVGVEPDPRMADVARANGLEVEVAPFEKWDAAGRRFDLLVSGTAWHWVDPVEGAAKAAEALRPSGRFAAFWNTWHHSRQVERIFADAYGAAGCGDRFAESYVLGWDPPIQPEDDEMAEGLAAAGFVDVMAGRRTVYAWSIEYTPQQWVDLAATHSDHRRLDASTLTAVLDQVRTALSRLGPTFRVDMTTSALTAVRP